MKCKVSRTAKIKPPFHSGKDDKRVLFCRPALVWKEAVAFPHLFFDQPRDLAPPVFEVTNVDFDALLERANLLFFLFFGVSLLAEPDCWDIPCDGLQRILIWSCADRDADFGVGLDFVFV